MKRRFALPVGILIVIAVFAACSASTAILSTVGSSVGGGDRLAAGQAGQPAAGGDVPGTAGGDQAQSGGSASGSGSGAGSGGASGSSTGQPVYDINDRNLLVIKTGSLGLQVDALDTALATASQKISAIGGYVSGSTRQGDGDTATASTTYRIPSAQWDAALVALRAIATKVLSEQTQTQDVTGQVVDLNARIVNLQATEQALQGIMAKAGKISDVLEVQSQLTDVRGQIEQAQAERNHLQDQASYSSLTVNYSLKEQAVVTTQKTYDPNSEVDRASASLVSIIQTVETAGIWFGIVWLPVLIVLSILGGILFAIARRVVRARDAMAVPPAVPPIAEA